MALAFAAPLDLQSSTQIVPLFRFDATGGQSSGLAAALAKENSVYSQQPWKLCCLGTMVAIRVRHVLSRMPRNSVRRIRVAFAGQLGGRRLLHREQRDVGVRVGKIEATTGHHLIGEELVDDNKSASDLAGRCIEEAQRLLYSSEHWVEKLVDQGVTVEVCDVLGPYAGSRVKLVRGLGEVDCSAEEFFKFQTSRLGFEATDEYIQNHRGVAEYCWERPGASENDPALQLNRVEWPYPLKTREYVSLDVIDPRTGIFLSKSCLHPERPGGSKYQDVVPPDEREFVRAVQYYAATAEPISEQRCRVRMVTWGELCDGCPASWVNEFNARYFVVPKFKRFRECLALSSDSDIMAHLANVTGHTISSVVWDLVKVRPGLRSLIAQFFSGSIGDVAKPGNTARM